MNTRRFHNEAFTLVELIVCIVIIAILAALSMTMMRRGMDSAHETQSIGQMRQIIAAIITRAADQGNFYALDEVGYSSYRSTDDPLGLPKILEKANYLKADKVWWAPGSRPALQQYGNSFCWNRSSTVCGKPVAVMSKPSTISVLWNNYCYTLPSVKNVPEATTGGPRTPATAYFLYPYRTGTGALFAYADGHVEMQILK